MDENVCPILIGHNYVRTVRLSSAFSINIDEALNKMISEEEEKGAELENITTAQGEGVIVVYTLTFFKPHPLQEEPE